MGHSIFSGHNSLDVTMRFAGGHIDVIFKLQHEDTTVSVRCQAHFDCFFHPHAPARQIGWAGARSYLAGDRVQWQKVKIR